MNLRFALDIIGAVLAGALIPIQTGYNTQLARAMQSPLLSTTVIFIVGLILMTAVVTVLRVPLPTAEQAAGAPWFSWIAGGVLGSIYVILLVMLAPRLGAGAVVAFVMLGQIVCSAAIDHFGLLGFVEHALNPPRILGMALLVAGAALVRLF
jgi:transporter family-2 protein